MLHPATELRPVCDVIGFGVYATAPIPRGTIIYVKDPLEIEIEENDYRLSNAALQPLIERYSYMEPSGTRVLSWDLAKYMNHSCAAVSLSTGYGFEIAVRDISPGEQITDDYGMLNIAESFRCHCGAANCRSEVTPDDFDAHAAIWDKAVKEALKLLRSVSQPLETLLDLETQKNLNHYLKTGKDYLSVKSLRCQLKADQEQAAEA